MDKQEIKQNIIAAAKKLYINDIDNIDIYIGGSSAISLLTDIPRMTLDIDIVSSLRSEKIRTILDKYQINDHLATSVDPNLREQYAYYEETSELLYEYKTIRFFIVWAEVVLLGKAFHKDRPKDIQDVKQAKGKLDNTKLDKACKSLLKYRTKDSSFDPFSQDVIDAKEELKGN